MILLQKQELSRLISASVFWVLFQNFYKIQRRKSNWAFPVIWPTERICFSADMNHFQSPRSLNSSFNPQIPLQQHGCPLRAAGSHQFPGAFSRLPTGALTLPGRGSKGSCLPATVDLFPSLETNENSQFVLFPFLPSVFSSPSLFPQLDSDKSYLQHSHQFHEWREMGVKWENEM